MEIIHQREQQMFTVQQDGKEAVLAYQIHGNNIDFYSTFVPPEFRGQGIAEKLVRAGIAWAKEQGYELTASCWYAAKFIK